MAHPVQVIYFDPDDAAADGCGWNMVADGSLACRYITVEDAIAVCAAAGLAYIVLSPGVIPAVAQAVLSVTFGVDAW
jgi:hypothetical protein